MGSATTGATRASTAPASAASSHATAAAGAASSSTAAAAGVATNSTASAAIHTLAISDAAAPARRRSPRNLGGPAKVSKLPLPSSAILGSIGNAAPAASSGVSRVQSAAQQAHKTYTLLLDYNRDPAKLTKTDRNKFDGLRQEDLSEFMALYESYAALCQDVELTARREQLFANTWADGHLGLSGHKWHSAVKVIFGKQPDYVLGDSRPCLFLELKGKGGSDIGTQASQGGQSIVGLRKANSPPQLPS